MRILDNLDPTSQRMRPFMLWSCIAITVTLIACIFACNNAASPDCSSQARLILPPDAEPGPAPISCLDSAEMVREIFGDGRDGDFIVPPAATFTLSRDMYWHDLTFPTNDGDSTVIDPNGFVIHISGIMRGPDARSVNSTLVLLSATGVLTKLLAVERNIQIVVATDPITGVPSSVFVGPIALTQVSPPAIHSTIIWSGFAVNRKWTITTNGAFPSMTVTSQETLLGVISRDGIDATGATGGAGRVAGSIGGSGAGVNGTTGSGAATIPFGSWPASFHAGNGGTGGFGASSSGGLGGGNTLLSETAGSMDIFNAIRMMIGSTQIVGGAGGAAGGGGTPGVALGGGGGGGGAPVVVLARSVENETNMLLSSQGGRGGDGGGVDAGGGGGGGGGHITTIVYRKPFPITVISGGLGGLKTSGGGVAGSPGAPGIVIPFSFVL